MEYAPAAPSDELSALLVFVTAADRWSHSFGPWSHPSFLDAALSHNEPSATHDPLATLVGPGHVPFRAEARRLTGGTLYRQWGPLEQKVGTVMIQQIKGKSIRLFLVDGTPQGILTAEIMNWTGHVLSAPRTKLTEMVKRPEMERTGIYVLVGPDPDGSEKPLVYIGESDVVGTRLVQHNKDESKDFWEKACVVTSKDQNLTKAHARYLESRLIAIAHGAGRARLFNGTAPDYGYLPEADLADMEYFISQIRLILPVLGLEFLREAPHVRPREREEVENADITPTFQVTSRKYDLTAEAREVEGDFVVLAGSEAQPEWIGQKNHHYRSLYEWLFQDGRLALNSIGKKAIFQSDVMF